MKCHLRNRSIITILVVLLLSSSLGKFKCVEARNNQKSLPPLLRRQSPLVSLDGTAGSNRGAALGVERSALTRDVITGVSGGECCDSTSILLGKVGVGAAIETTLMYQLIKLSITISARDNNNNLSSLTKRIIQTTTLLLIIFASSTFGSVIDMGLSAASRQVLDIKNTPNEGWYMKLQKPVWNPPGWVFPIMWLIVSKPTQFIAVSKVMDNLCSSTTAAAAAQSKKNGVGYLPLLVYCTHLSLGDAWNKVFFGLQCTGRGLAVILIFWSVLWTSVYLFYQVDKAAGLFLVPTGLWVTVAAALNGSIYVLNK